VSAVDEAVQRNPFSRRYALMRAGRPVGELRSAMFGPSARLEVDGGMYRLRRERAFSGAFALRDGDGRTLAVAEKPARLRARFRLDLPGGAWTMEKAGGLRRSFVLRPEGAEAATVGTLRPRGLLRRRVDLTLPPSWDAPRAGFVLWLAILVWHLEDAAAAG
jgi:hypothetical protein